MSLRFCRPASAHSEKIGLSADPSLSVYGSYYVCGGSVQTIKAASGVPVDWNCDKRIDASVAADINGDGSVTDLNGAAGFNLMAADIIFV